MKKSTAILDCFKRFIVSDNSYDMYVTGRAGTGKTTELHDVVQFCIDNNIGYVVCAFTHDACKILRSKLPEGARVSTLHKFIKKRPSVNTEAMKLAHVSTNSRFGTIDEEYLQVCFIDEYSQVGEKDRMDLQEAQDVEEEYDEEGDPIPGKVGLRICWLGDPFQLPPVGDVPAVVPHGPFCVTLKKQYRLKAANPLTKAIDQLVSFIEGAKPEPLIVSEYFQREVDIVEKYKSCAEDKVLLAYTNKRVQHLNWTIEGKTEPEEGDVVYSPTTKQRYTFVRYVPAYEVYCIDRAFGDPLELRTKYKALEFLKSEGYSFCEVEDEEGVLYTFCFVFGHYEYKMETENLKALAAGANKAIFDETGVTASQWARDNLDSRKAKDRAYLWRKFLCFNENIICLDFAHAKTVHKSQGSTIHTVFLDSEDLGLAAESNYLMYLKLMYVALSRATNYVYTN